jgi:uncharacterized protein (DUF488 family)
VGDLRLLTFGHGTATAGELVELLHGAGIEEVVDVRRYPGSRRHPHVAREEMERWMPDAGIEYVWAEPLGGRRKVVAGSPHVGLRNEQFRAYADHMETPPFLVALTALLDDAAARTVAVMCSESVWWRCHRRLLSDHLVLVDGVAVEHLFHDGTLRPHEPTAEARVDDSCVVYDLGQARLL